MVTLRAIIPLNGSIACLSVKQLIKNDSIIIYVSLIFGTLNIGAKECVLEYISD